MRKISMHRFYSSEALNPGAVVTLSFEQSHHLARVLRVEPGETIWIIDGKGTLAEASVVDSSPKRSRAEVVRTERRHSRSQVTIAFALPKSAALDFLIRRATELGVRAFQPLETHHSLRLKDWNADRWEKVVAEVCKQCEELWFPELYSPASLTDWIRQRDRSRFLLWCDEANREPREAIRGPCDLVIGAEGGWDDAERAAFQSAGAKSLGLGRNRLRAETAALTALVLAKREMGEL